MGGCPRSDCRGSTRASSTSRNPACTCTSPDSRSSGRARTARSSPTTTWSGSWRLGCAWLRGCGGSCGRSPATSPGPSGSTTTGSTSTSTCAGHPSPSPGGRFELERAVGRVLSRPLDRTKPLWELYVFEDLSEDRTAILLKIHHAMADGIGNMMIASALFDLAADAPTGEPDGGVVSRAGAADAGSDPRRGRGGGPPPDPEPRPRRTPAAHRSPKP